MARPDRRRPDAARLLRRSWPLMLTACGAAVAGDVMARAVLRDIDPVYTASAVAWEEPASAAATPIEAFYGEAQPVAGGGGCGLDCAAIDLGYREAERGGWRSAAACDDPMPGWRQGCLAYVGHTTGLSYR